MKKPITDIFPYRLSQARKMRGYSLEKLAQLLATPITRQAINKYEKGQMKPDSSVLIALADALNVKVDYFFRPFTVEIDRVEFRKKEGFTEKMSARLKERVMEELERYLEIEQISGSQVQFSLPRRRVTTLEEVRDFARLIRDYLSLGRDGISNVIEVLEDNGIKVIEIPENENFDGLSGFANGTIPLIVVNGAFPSEGKRFTALHELGHLLLDLPDNIANRDGELFCNAFAREMLLPADVLKSKLGETRHDISLAELTDIQSQFGISIDEIMRALKELEVISENRYKVFRKKRDTIAEFRELVEKSRVRMEKSGRFARMVYRALADEIITVSKAAVLLNTSIGNIKSTLQLV